MRKAITILWLSITMVSLLGSCQKEEYKNAHILITVDPPLTTNGSDYVLSGQVISSGKIDLADYGFDVFVGTDFVRYSLGALQKQGKVQTIVTPSNPNVTEVVLYAYDEFGSYYSSKGNTGNTPSISFSNPLLFSAPGHSSDASNHYFSGTISNSNTTEYVVFEYGVQFRESASSTWDGELPIFSGYDYNASIPVNGSIPTTPSPFAAGTSYNFRLYARVKRISDGAVNIFSGGENTFATAAL